MKCVNLKRVVVTTGISNGEVLLSNRVYKQKHQRFYRIPIKQDKRRLWLAAIQRKDFNPPLDAVICSAHFIGGEDYMKQLD